MKTFWKFLGYFVLFLVCSGLGHLIPRGEFDNIIPSWISDAFWIALALAIVPKWLFHAYVTVITHIANLTAIRVHELNSGEVSIEEIQASIREPLAVLESD